MKISLQQADIEQAIKKYVASMGIARPVDRIEFNVSRKGGTSIEAEIDMADPALQTNNESPVAVSAVEPETEQKEPEPAKTEPPFDPDTAEPANDTPSVEATSRSLFG
jgi:hypothetical protein